MSLVEFTQYCWSFYGPGQIYGEFFGHKLTMAALDKACLKVSKRKDYEGDTFDRERVRDLLLSTAKQ